MSKLITRLEQTSEGRAQPLGFGPAAAREKSAAMLIIAGVAPGDPSAIDHAIKAGADALLLSVTHLESEKQSLSKVAPTLNKMPWGVALDEITSKELEELDKLGCDFIVFQAAGTPASILIDERVGKILHVDPSLSDGAARMVNRLDVDAVFIDLAGDKTPLTVAKLLAYGRITGLIGKHVVATIPDALNAGELETLLGIGVRGVVVDAAGDLAQLRERIRKVPPAGRRKRGKSLAILPAITREAEAPPEEEEEDGEED